MKTVEFPSADYYPTRFFLFLYSTQTMAKAGKKRQQKTLPAQHNKKPKRVSEDDDATQSDQEVYKSNV